MTTIYEKLHAQFYTGPKRPFKKVSKLIQEGQEVLVRLIPEHDDAKAIASKRCLDGTWIRIGCVVHDALN